MSKKGRSVSMGTYSGSATPDVQKRQSYKGFGKPVGASRTLTFYGLARGKEYTPLTGGSGRIIIIHGIAKLVVDEKVEFEIAYVTARFKALRFARQLKLQTFYEFTDFLYETWDPKVISPTVQDKLHSFMFAEYNVTSDKVKELDGDGPFPREPRLILSTIGEIHKFFAGADPRQFGKEKPVLCCRFKTIANNGDNTVGNGMIRSAWCVSDMQDSITYSAIGDSRTRFSLVVGKEYKAYGFSVYYNGNSPPILQPTMWAHLEECTAEAAFDDIATLENEDEVEKYFIFTMVKFAAISMTCPAHDCQSLVDAATLNVLLVCPRCDASFRLDSKKLQIKMMLNGNETAPMVGKDGSASTMQGPSIENFRITDYSVVQQLFGMQHPEKLMSKPKKLHQASAEAMARLYKVSYHRESLVISKIEKCDEKLSDLYDADGEDSSETDGSDVSPKKRKTDEASSSRSSSKKSRKAKYKKTKKRRRHRKGKKRSRRSSSSGSSTSGGVDVESSDVSDDSSTASVKTRCKRRYGFEKSEASTKKDESGRSHEEKKERERREEEAKDREESEQTKKLDDDDEDEEAKEKRLKEQEQKEDDKEKEKQLEDSEVDVTQEARTEQEKKERIENENRRKEEAKQKEQEQRLLAERLTDV